MSKSHSSMIKKNERKISMDRIKDLEGEIWADIEGFPSYQISNKGRVKSFKKRNARLLTAFPNNYGYWRVALTNPFG